MQPANLPLSLPRPLRTLRLSDGASSSSSSSSSSAASPASFAPDTLSPLQLPCASDGAYLLMRRAPEDNSGTSSASVSVSQTETDADALLARMGSSTTVLFDGCAPASSSALTQRRKVRLAGLPLAKLSLYESQELDIELHTRLLTSSIEVFRCSNISLLIAAPASSDAAAPAAVAAAAAAGAPADAAGFRCASLSLLSASQAQDPPITQPPPPAPAWTLGTLQLDAPLRNVCVSFASRESVGSIILAPLPSASDAVEEEVPPGEEGRAALRGFHNVTVRYATPGGAGWTTFLLDGPSAVEPPRSSAAAAEAAAASRPPAGTQHLLSLSPAGQWQLERLRRAQGASGYTSLGVNEPVVRQRGAGGGRRGSVDSGIGL